MAQESCNLDKEETEILKPSSSSSSSPTPPVSSTQSSSSSSAAAAVTPLFMNSAKEFSLKRSERPETPPEDPRPSARVGNRCSTCRKRVGLTGFRCRCGDLFCGLHRYSDIHDCSFDYKAMGREEITKANPVVRAAKIIKI